MQEGYEFDDVLIEPIPSFVSSRDYVDISVMLSDRFRLAFPLLASPMVGVVDGKFAKLLSDLGGLAILHRFYKTKGEMYADVKDNLTEKDNYGISIKIGEQNFNEIFDYTSPKIVLVDTANGYIKSLQNYCYVVKHYISKHNLDILLMAGNVVTPEGFANLTNVGCDLIRVGIGGGSPCSTRNVTGIGIPNLTAIMRCAQAVRSNGAKIVLDGGIKNSGDFVKSIVAGAHLAMSGKLYAECYESPNEGVLYGMASRTHMENLKVDVKSVEGFDTPIVKKHSLAQFVREFGFGIKSAGTYLNASNLESMLTNGKFIHVSDHAIKKGL